MSKDLHFQLMARVEMPEAVFKRLKSIESEMIFKGYYNPSMRDVYSENAEWNEVQKTIKEAIEYRNELESEMRVKKQIDDYGNYRKT